MRKLLFISSIASFWACVHVNAAAPNVDFTVNMSEAVNVSGCPTTCPRIEVNVGGQARYAEYFSGSGTSSLTFRYMPTVGDIDLDGVFLSPTVDLNDGLISDLNGNAVASLNFIVPDTSGVKIDYPSLSMDFTHGVSGRYTIEGSVYNDFSSFLSASGGTFLRNNVATYFDSTGILQVAGHNQPRFDHDPYTYQPKGILLEESRVNQFLRSTEIDHPQWEKTFATVLANVEVAPDGTFAADKIIDTTDLGGHGIRYVAALAGDTVYTVSIFAKAGERFWIRLFAADAATNSAYVNFNLSTCSVGTIAGGGTYTVAATRAQNIGGGWCRVSMSYSIPTTTTRIQYLLRVADGTASSSYTGDGASGLYLWGAQLEAGNFITSYIPTSAAAMGRPSDSLTIPVSDWHNHGAGTVYADFSWDVGPGASWPMIWQFADGTNDNRWNLFYARGTSRIGIDAFNGGVLQGSFQQDQPLIGEMKVSAAQAINDANVVFGNSLMTKDTSWNPPAVNYLRMSGINGVRSIRALKYYPARAPDEQLLLLTE